MKYHENRQPEQNVREYVALYEINKNYRHYMRPSTALHDPNVDLGFFELKTDTPVIFLLQLGTFTTILGFLCLFQLGACIRYGQMSMIGNVVY